MLGGVAMLEGRQASVIAGVVERWSGGAIVVVDAER
jgi:hypothetical protein